MVIRNGQPEHTRLRGWLDGHDGPVPSYRIELVTRVGNYKCPYTATAPDMFEALVRLRRQLEPDGLTVAVQGARRDTYPSGMARDMGGGMRVYVLRPDSELARISWRPLMTRRPVRSRRSGNSGHLPTRGGRNRSSAETASCRPAAGSPRLCADSRRLCRAPVAALNGGQPRRQARQSGSGVLCLEPPGAVSRGHDPFRGGARPGSGGAQGRRLVRSGVTGRRGRRSAPGADRRGRGGGRTPRPCGVSPRAARWSCRLA